MSDKHYLHGTRHHTGGWKHPTDPVAVDELIAGRKPPATTRELHEAIITLTHHHGFTPREAAIRIGVTRDTIYRHHAKHRQGDACPCRRRTTRTST